MSEVIKVQTWEECCSKIETVRRTNSAQELKLLFRGLSDSTWLLSTTLERCGGAPTFSFRDYYRMALRIRAEIETESGLKWNVPPFEEISSWAAEYDQKQCDIKAYEYLAHLRHNGFPSPLLDWSLLGTQNDKLPPPPIYFSIRQCLHKALFGTKKRIGGEVEVVQELQDFVALARWDDNLP